MQGDAQVLVHLNQQLKLELTAINQYFLHARMLKNWGLLKMAKHEYEESIEEMKHADRVIERILYLDGVPNLQRYNPVLVGETVPEQLALELETEKAAIERYNRSIALAVAKGDNGTRDLLESILHEEEDGIDWLESQLHLARQLGTELYLAEQMHE